MLRRLSFASLLLGLLSAVDSSSPANFRVAGGKIYDPDGHLFSVAGVNLRDPSVAAQVLSLLPGINFVRVAMGSPEFAAGPKVWDGFVKTMTAQRVVSHIEHHPFPFPPAYRGANLTREAATYARWAAHYKHNPYVWFGSMNEPHGGNKPGGMAAISAQHVATYDAVRKGAGATNMILLEAGEGAGNPGKVGVGSGLVEESYSSMVNVAWDLHQYGWMSKYSTDQALVNAVLLGWADNSTGIRAAQGIRSADGVMPVVNAEFGIATNGGSTPAKIDPNKDELVFAVTNWSVSHGYSSGFAGWNWDTNGWAGTNNAVQRNGKLTEWGTKLAAAIAATHQPRAADSVGFRCTTDTDCELLGKCVARRCRCDPGFTGPSCAQLNLAPHALTLPAWPPLEGYALGDHRRAAGWGFTVAPDANTATLHAVANVGCYSPANMVIGTLLMHLTSTGPAAPWKAVGIVAPPTTFNPHLRLSPKGGFVLFLRHVGSGIHPPAMNWTEAACGGVNDSEWAAMVKAGPCACSRLSPSPCPRTLTFGGCIACRHHCR